MFSMSAFWVLIVFYVVAKICFFSGVYIVTKAIERRAIREKKKRLESFRLYEIESSCKRKQQPEECSQGQRTLWSAAQTVRQLMSIK